MGFFRSRAFVACVASTLTALVVGGVAFAAIPDGRTGKVTACYPKSGASKGVLRVIDYESGARCRTSEAILTWQGSGMRWRGSWATTRTYYTGDVVGHAGSSYIATKTSSHISPPNISYWALMAAKGDAGVGSSGASTLDDLKGAPCNIGDPATGTLSITYPVNGSGNVTMKCVPTNLRTLTVTTSGVTGEYAQHVDVTGPSINCGASGTTCAGTYLLGTSVTLVAHSDSTVSFADWSGDQACGTNPSCTVTMDQARTVSANYDPITTQAFHVEAWGEMCGGECTSFGGPTGSGVVASSMGWSCSQDCDAIAPTFSDVTLTAIPGPNSYVAGLLGPCASATGATCTVHMDSAKHVRVNFGPNVVHVTGSCPPGTPDSRGSCGTIGFTSTHQSNIQVVNNPIPCAEFTHHGCTEDFYLVPLNDAVTLVAHVDAGFTYVWTGVCQGTIGNTCTFNATGGSHPEFSPLEAGVSLTSQ